MLLIRHKVYKWWRHFVGIHPVEDRPRSGRPLTVNQVAKIVCAKVADKRDQSAWKLATRLSRKGYRLSKSTVWRFMMHSLGLKAYRRAQKLKISEKQQKVGGDSTKIGPEFGQKLRNWMARDLSWVIWSDD